MEKNKIHFNKTKDEKLFLDLALLSSCKDIDGESILKNFDSFMRYVTKLDTDSAVEVFRKSHEQKVFPRLGYGSNESSSGHGLKSEYFREPFEILKSQPDYEDFLYGNIFTVTLVKEYGEDANTDLLLNLSIRELSEYTEKAAREFNLDTRNLSAKVWDRKLNNWVLANDITVVLTEGTEDDYRLLIPNEVLLEKLPYSTKNFILKIMYVSEKSKRKNLTQDIFLKEIMAKYGSNNNYIVDILREYPDFILEYIKRYSSEQFIKTYKRQQDEKIK
ncbi:hypothetical protein [Companilactobacillus metriopterae]|uniref:hypothetical protein n=1 Tax=Companilactobacillus metriopterae TaxID=1909267 RepID=UPI00100A6412|nr:hypothetical protein [Companilactobacillus metriopterae]